MVHPLFNILKKISICQQHKYQLITFKALSKLVIGTLVKRVHSIGFSPAGGLVSVAISVVILTASGEARERLDVHYANAVPVRHKKISVVQFSMAIPKHDRSSSHTRHYKYKLPQRFQDLW